MELSAGPATSHVLTTPELLENILSHLPPASLLHSQLVCRYFQSLISTSPLLESRLFFRPNPSTSKPPPSISDSNPNPFTLNPFLTTAFPGWFQPYVPGSPCDTGGRPPLPQCAPHFSSEGGFALLPWNEEGRRDAFRRKEASWRRMLIVDPPAKRIEFINAHSAMGGSTRDVAIVELRPAGKGGEEKKGEPRIVISKPAGSSVCGEEGKSAAGMSGGKKTAPNTVDEIDDDALGFNHLDEISGLEKMLDLSSQNLSLHSLKRESAAPPREEVLRDEGLRMGVLYDYIEAKVCRATFHRPTFTIRFSVHNDVPKVAEAAQDDDVTEATAEQEAADAKKEGEKSKETTLKVDLSYFYGCLMEEEPPMPDYRSEGYEEVGVKGEWVTHEVDG